MNKENSFTTVKIENNLLKLKDENIRTSKYISELNKNLTSDVFVPITENLAYFKGKIKNTNECKVYLGEDLFVHTTNYRAIQILENRLNRLNSLIQINSNYLQSEIKSNEKSLTDLGDLNKNIKSLGDGTFEILEEENTMSTQMNFISNNDNYLKLDQIRRNLQKFQNNSYDRHPNDLNNSLFKVDTFEEIKSKEKLIQNQKICTQNSSDSKRSKFFEDDS